MKHARIFLIAIAITSGVFFGTTTKAESVYQDAFVTPPYQDYCFQPQSGLELCSNTTFNTYNGGAVLKLWQEILVAPSTADPTIPISAVELNAPVYSRFGAEWPTNFAYLINDVGDVVATSTVTAISGGSVGTVKFPFSPAYEVSTSTPVVEVRFDLTVPGGTNAAPHFGVSPDLYPPPEFTAFTNLWDGAWDYNGPCCGFGKQDFANDYDLEIRVYRDDTQLKIISPFNYEIWTERFVDISGTCADGFDIGLNLQLFKTSSTTADHETLYAPNCTTNAFQIVTGLPEDGEWLITASSTDGKSTLSTFFYTFNAQTATNTNELQENLLEDLKNVFSCEIPFLSWDPCFAGAQLVLKTRISAQSLVQSTYNDFISTEPYSYIPTVVDTFNSATTTATSSIAFVAYNLTETSTPLTLASSSLPLTFDLFTGSQFLSILDQSQWDALRPAMQILLTLLFALYVYHRLIKSV